MRVQRVRLPSRVRSPVKGCRRRRYRFTAFECPECGYSPTAAKYKADQATFNHMTDEEQGNLRREHVALGRHWHIELYMGPMPKFGMRRVGADQLHLVYLNMFKHLFKYTVHEALPDSKKKIVRSYVVEAGFYSYDAAADTEDPVKHWIGREIKRFLHEADEHLPFLLGLAAAPIDKVGDATGSARAGDESMDVSDDDEFAPNEEEVEAEAGDDVQLLMQNADRWDRFLNWVRDIETPWTDDSEEYRKFRALQYCNGARGVARDLLALKPTMASWVPHIACNIVPRQLLELGDASSRSADACESYGACAKNVIKHLTCRRRLRSDHGRGYIEQAFRRLAVRSDLLHGPENAPFLQRKDHRLLGTGCSNAQDGRRDMPHMSIRFKVELEAELA